MTMPVYYPPCRICREQICINSDLIMIDGICSKCLGKPQDSDPYAPHYFPPFDDSGNKRTIDNAVDCGWSAID